MAVDVGDVARLGIEVDSSKVRTATADLARFQGTAQGVGREAQRLGGRMTAFLTAPILGAGAIAVKTAADYETLQVQLEVLLGSAEQAEQVFGRLSEFAATTPFELEGITRANNLLLGFGLNVEETFDLLQTLGDVSAVTGGSLFDMARVFGEARAEGNLLTRDLRQLVNQGVPAIQLLAESLGVAESEIFDMASAGEISFERLVAAFEKATEQGGLFFDGMGQRSNTLTGIFSNLADSVNLSLGSIGNTLIETLDIKGVTRELIADIEAATEWFNNLDTSAQRMIITLTGIVAAAGPVIAILGTLSLAIGAISAPVAAVVTAVGAGTALIISNWQEVEAYFSTGGGAQMWTDLQSIVENTVGIITGLWDEMGNEVIQITEYSFGIVVETIETSLANINKILSKFNGTFDDELNIFEDNIFTTLDKIDAKLVSFAGSFAKWLYKEFVADPLQALDVLQTEAERSAEQAGDSLKAAKERIMRELENRDDTIIQPEIDFDIANIRRNLEVALAGMDRMSEPVTVPADNLIEIDWEAFERDIFRPEPNWLSERLFPEGSVGALQERIQELQRRIEESFDRDTIAGYQEEIEELQNQINELTGDAEEGAKQVDQAARQLGFTFSSAFEDAIIRGESFREVLSGILEDIARIALRTAITRPLGEALAGGISDINLFGGGGTESVNDALITKEGKIIKGHPNDNWMAFQGDRPPGSGANVNINVINETGSQVEVQERQNANGGMDIDLMIKRSVQDGFNRGAFDGPMSRNFGVTRKGRR